jgi:hypothetical protein
LPEIVHASAGVPEHGVRFARGVSHRNIRLPCRRWQPPSRSFHGGGVVCPSPSGRPLTNSARHATRLARRGANDHITIVDVEGQAPCRPQRYGTRRQQQSASASAGVLLQDHIDLLQRCKRRCRSCGTGTPICSNMRAHDIERCSCVRGASSTRRITTFARGESSTSAAMRRERRSAKACGGPRPVRALPDAGSSSHVHTPQGAALRAM